MWGYSLSSTISSTIAAPSPVWLSCCYSLSQSRVVARCNDTLNHDNKDEYVLCNNPYNMHVLANERKCIKAMMFITLIYLNFSWIISTQTLGYRTELSFCGLKPALKMPYTWIVFLIQALESTRRRDFGQILIVYNLEVSIGFIHNGDFPINCY